MKRIFTFIGLGMMLSVSAISMNSQASDALKTFPIGALFPMTGPQAYYGRVMSHAALTAIDKLNADGGVEGYNFKLEIVDYKNVDVDLAIAGLQKLISTKRLSFLLTSFSAITLAVQPICAENHILMINGGAYSPNLANKPYLHNLKLFQSQLIPPMLDFFWEMNIRKLGVVYFETSGGEVPAKELVEPLWKKLGGQIIAMEPHKPGLTDYTPLLSRVKAGRPDAIYDISTGQDQAYLIKNAREMGIDIPICIGDWGLDFHIIAGGSSENVFIPEEHFDTENLAPEVQQFVKAYESRWGELPDLFAANYYEAVYFILPNLIQRTMINGKNPMDGEELEKALWQNPTFKTLYGDKLVLNKDGTCNKPMAISKIVNGKKVVIKKIASR